MHDRQIWKRSMQRISVALPLIWAVTACGGGGSNGSEPDNNDQSGAPIVNDPNNQNTPPRIQAPELVTISHLGYPLIVGLQVSDADNDSITATWALESSPENGDLVIEPYFGLVDAFVSATVVGEYVISVLATDGIASTYESIRVEVTNSPPLIIGLTIEPEVLTSSSTAYANIDNSAHIYSHYSDIDYIWRINDGDPLASNSPNLYNYSLFERGDQISVEVIASDGESEVRAITSNFIVSNAPPELDSLSVEPFYAGANDDLSVEISNLSDPDGDQISVTHRWFLNGEELTGQTGDVLPRGIARAGDTVYVDVTLFDGSDSAVYSSSELQLINTASYLETEPRQVIINHGSPSSFIAKFVDYDGEVVQTELSHAPSGLTYDTATGTVSWTPTSTMFASEENFYAHFTSSDGEADSVQIIVRNDQYSPVLARSGNYIPGSDFELDIGDFDGDGRNEVLSTNSREHIFTLEFNGESITQDWLYPFAVEPGEPIVRVWAFGAERSQILVVTNKGVSLIKSRTDLPTRILDTNYEIAAAVLDDLDKDGIEEVVLFTEDGVMSKLNTQDWSLSTFGETINSSDWPIEHYTVVAGNIDDDPALELVVESGHVIDGATGEIQWAHFSRFGNNIAIGDVDGDGDTDIVTSDRWDKVTSYDPIAKTSIWTYNIDDFCSLRLYNVDNDPQDELIAGPCQHGSVKIYDGVSGSMVLQEDIDDQRFNSSLRSYSFGDLDNDDVKELIFSTGSGSTASNNMAVVSLTSLGDSTSHAVVNANPAQISVIKSVGWDTTTSISDRAVFVLGNTEGMDSGQRVGLLSPDGTLSISQIIAPNWDDLAAGVVIDSNADGISEVVVGVGNVRQGEVHHLTLNDFTQTFLHTDLGGAEPYERAEIISMSLGIDSDGTSKAIIATSELKLQIYDIASRQVDWNSGGLSGGQINEAIAINMESGFNVVAATYSELTIWKKTENAYAKTNTANIECSSLRHVVINTQHQIACLKSDVWGRESTVTLFDMDLNKMSELLFDYAVTAIRTTPQGALLIGARVPIPGSASFFDAYEHTLRTINPVSGVTLWKSAPLLGEINEITFTEPPAGGRSKMAISTASTMYIVE